MEKPSCLLPPRFQCLNPLPHQHLQPPKVQAGVIGLGVGEGVGSGTGVAVGSGIGLGVSSNIGAGVIGLGVSLRVGSGIGAGVISSGVGEGVGSGIITGVSSIIRAGVIRESSVQGSGFWCQQGNWCRHWLGSQFRCRSGSQFWHLPNVSMLALFYKEHVLLTPSVPLYRSCK